MTKKTIHLSDDLSLPLNAVTQTWGWFGRKGSGKTYAAGVLVEEFLRQQFQTVIIDPVGNWYGLRLSKTGKSKSGFQIPVIGGEHGDIPIEETAGSLIAKTIIDTGTSAVIDVSAFRKAQRRRFVADFSEELFHRKKQSRSPMHLVLEEAQLFAPQKIPKGDERLLGAIEDIVRLGRNYGIGCSMISQRPQSVNTEVRNQCEPLVILQLIAKHERDAVGGWMQHMGVEMNLTELSKLKTGECFFWSPAWLGKFVKTKFRGKETFDASSTPSVGGEHRQPAKLGKLDLNELQQSMAETIEKAKADDPKELKKRIKQLEREVLAPSPVVEKAAIDHAVGLATRERDKHWQNELSKVANSHKVLADRIGKIHQLSNVNGDGKIGVIRPPDQEPLPIRSTETASRSSKSFTKQVKEKTSLGGGSLRMVQVLADRYPAKFTESQWATLSKLKKTGGTWSTYKSRLVNAELVDRTGGLWIATELAVDEYGDPSRSPETPEEIREQWKGRLGSGPSRMIDALTAGPLDRTELAEECGLTASAGTFGTYLSRLRSNGLVVVDRGIIELAEVLQ